MHRTGEFTTVRLFVAALELIPFVHCKVDTVRAVNVTSQCKVDLYLFSTLEF